MAPASVAVKRPPPEMVKLYAWDDHGQAEEVFLPLSALDEPDFVHLGLLDVIVLGLRQGSVVVIGRISEDDPHGTVTRSCTQALPMTQQQLLERCTQPMPDLPRWVILGLDGEWFAFQGWRFMHCLVGDHGCLRLHVYSRSIEEHPSCATARRGLRPSRPTRSGGSKAFGVPLGGAGRTRSQASGLTRSGGRYVPHLFLP